MSESITFKVFGPPGTGKTTWIVRKINELLTSGKIRKDYIAAISLTKATKWALLEKLHKEGIAIESSNISTMHSWAYRLLSSSILKPPLVSCIDLASFFSKYKIDYSCTEEELKRLDIDESPYIVQEEGAGNVLYQAFNKVRLLNPFPDTDKVRAFFRKEDIGYISEETFVKLFMDYMNFLDKKKLFDFTSLLEKALEYELLIGGDVLVIDEFQDFGALHHLLIQSWLPRFR